MKGSIGVKRVAATSNTAERGKGQSPRTGNGSNIDATVHLMQADHRSWPTGGGQDNRLLQPYRPVTFPSIQRTVYGK